MVPSFEVIVFLNYHSIQDSYLYYCFHAPALQWHDPLGRRSDRNTSEKVDRTIYTPAAVIGQQQNQGGCSYPLQH